MSIQYGNPIFISIFLQIMAKELNDSNSGNLTNTLTATKQKYSNSGT